MRIPDTSPWGWNMEVGCNTWIFLLGYPGGSLGSHHLGTYRLVFFRVFSAFFFIVRVYHHPRGSTCFLGWRLTSGGYDILRSQTLCKTLPSGHIDHIVPEKMEAFKKHFKWGWPVFRGYTLLLVVSNWWFWRIFELSPRFLWGRSAEPLYGSNRISGLNKIFSKLQNTSNFFQINHCQFQLGLKFWIRRLFDSSKVVGVDGFFVFRFLTCEIAPNHYTNTLMLHVWNNFLHVPRFTSNLSRMSVSNPYIEPMG